VIPTQSEARNKVIVLDRDGTIVIDRHYLSDPAALEFEPGAAVGLRKMTDMGFRLVVITNQSGIARGMFSLARLNEVHERMRQMLRSIGVRLDGIYSCPHGPEEGCDCRKPNLELMRQASKELGFDMSQSIVIGDKDSDIEFGRRAGAVTMLIGQPGPRSPAAPAPDFVVENLNVAADIIGSREERLSNRLDPKSSL
jgi:D-glycero-D-manno-heptose 1,7-bisphosphate phosphatase